MSECSANGCLCWSFSNISSTSPISNSSITTPTWRYHRQSHPNWGRLGRVQPRRSVHEIHQCQLLPRPVGLDTVNQGVTRGKGNKTRWILELEICECDTPNTDTLPSPSQSSPARPSSHHVVVQTRAAW